MKGELIRKEDLVNIKVICFDRDGVVAKRGTWWEEGKIRTYKLEDRIKEKVGGLTGKYFVCITSGRSLEFLEDEWQGIDISLHGEIGNFVKYDGSLYEEEWTDEEIKSVEEIRRELEALKSDKIKGFEPKKKIISLHCWERVAEVEEIARNDLLYCWWNGEAYDVGPKRINKLTGIKKWIKVLGVDLEQVMMVGHGVTDQGAMGGVGLTVSVAGDEEVGGEKLVERLLELI